MTNLFSSSLRRILSAAVAVFCLSLTAPAFGQFSGNPVSPNTPVNVPTTATTDPAILFPSDPSLVLEQGDLLNLRIFGATDYTPSVRVGADGTVLLPLIGIVPVSGLSVQQAEERIAGALVAAGMYVNPQVNIQVTETPNHFISVLGEVKNPSSISAAINHHLLDALNAAGGMNPDASHTITILRPSIPQPIVVDLGVNPVESAATNIPVFTGDTIIVSRLGAYYVLGAVKAQGAFQLKANSPTTLLNAFAAASGPLFESKSREVHIIRTIGTTRKVVTVDFSRIASGKDPDPVIEADDIIYVPTSLLKAALKSNGIGTLLGVASLAYVVVAQH